MEWVLTNIKFQICTLKADEIFVDASQQYQKIFGFGGAFTDASGFNIAKLSILTQQNLLKYKILLFVEPKFRSCLKFILQCRSYFSEEGLEYGIGRVPIGGSDFSLRAYSYDDSPADTNLTNFALTREDLFYKVQNVLQLKVSISVSLSMVVSQYVHSDPVHILGSIFQFQTHKAVC